MLLNRTLKKDKFFQQTTESKFCSTGSSTLKSKLSNSPLNELTQYQLQLLNYKQSLIKDINHPRIRQLIMNHERIDSLMTSPQLNIQNKQNIKNNRINLQLLQQRKWLTKKGKKYLIDFDDNQRKQMKDCFNAMDVKKNGSIGIDQLQQLLISVGLMQSRQQVKQLIDSVDQDKSGKIQFSQFLKMILNDQGQNQEIVQFFKFIINSNRKKDQQQIQWTKKSKSKSRSKSKDVESPSKNKVSFFNDKENIFYHSQIDKSTFHQNRNKFYSSPQNLHFSQNNKRNSALNIFLKHPHPKNLPFGMIVSHIRRKHMMTALKISKNDQPNLKKINSSGYSQNENRSNHYISSNILRSSQNMKQSKASSNQTKSIYTQEQVNKGQSVMNALRKMWDRRLLREIKQKKMKKELNAKTLISPLTQKGRQINKSINKSILPNVS